MKRFLTVSGMGIILILLVIFLFQGSSLDTLNTENTLTEKTSAKGSMASSLSVNAPRSIHTIPCLYYNAKEFKASISGAPPTDSISGSIIGGIVPHHLLAGRMISDFFKTLAKAQPEIIVVIAPNHKRIGSRKVHTGGWTWETPFGALYSHTDTVKALINDMDVATDFKLFEEEHSISGLIPYIKHYMPEARIVPVLLHGNYGLENSRKLGAYIQQAVKDKNSVIIASVDFSHYLTVDEADQRDEQTLEAIRSRDFEKISRMTNDHLDSPPSVIALLSAMDNAGADKMEVLAHNNSARIAKADGNYTTSYFTLIFSK